ncbi:hypothetical protein IWX78_002687 [Mycetocola sp. CAN_C7]|uniref:HNH endonuclease signature motif containing protein n=1 Tax=Mycetocola sp. CAN_C7 TaxID=2787724 RepID=UPI0018CA0FE3
MESNDTVVGPPVDRNSDPPDIRADVTSADAASADAASVGSPDPVGDEFLPPSTLYAMVADTCSALVDAVAEVEKLEALQAAWKVELIDHARSLAVTSGEGVVATERPRTMQQRNDLALRSFIAELACMLRIPERTATALVDDSSTLMHRLPLTMAALRDATISFRHAQQLVDQVSTLTDEAAAELEEKALPFATTMTAARFRQKTRMLRERLQPESAVDRCAKSVSDRRVEMVPAADGMAWLNLFTTAPRVEAMFSTIRAQSMRLQSPVEPRTLSQLDADVVVGAMIESFIGEFSSPDVTGTRIFGTGLGTSQYDLEEPPIDASCESAQEVATAARPATGQKTGAAFRLHRVSVVGPGYDPVQEFRKIVPTVMVTVPVLTLLGKSDEPGTLDGYGPIDPETARDLTAQASEFSRILTHPETGVALSLGQTKYKPSNSMKRFLRYRDGYCRFPGCHRRAVSCDIDHTDPFGSGGGTDVDNLAHLCPKHHKMKHEIDWQVHQLGDGVLMWRSPQGREYVTHPENPVRGPVPPTKARRPENAPHSGGDPINPAIPPF